MSGAAGKWASGSVALLATSGWLAAVGKVAAEPPASRPAESEPGATDAPQSEIRIPQSEVSPQRPVLVGEVAERVEKIEKRMEELRKEGKYEEAIALAEQVLAIRREHQTGWTNAKGEPAEWYEIGDARRAVEDLRRWITFSAEQRAELQEADAAGSKAEELYAQGKYAEALALTRTQLEIRRQHLGEDHPYTLNSTSAMGVLLKSIANLAEAELYHRKALEGRRRVLGDEHPDTLTSIGNMGLLLESMGKLPDAEPYSREALEGSRRVLGNDHPDTLRSINNMGLLLKSMGKYAEAEPYYREALEGARRVLGDDHAHTLTSINNMGALLHSMGKLAEAEPYFRKALEAQRRVLGDEHPSTLNSINNMGVLLQAMGKLAETEPYFREALEGRRRLLGDDHPSTLISINSMGFLLKSMGKHAEAQTHYREALEGFRRVLGDDHPHTLGSINNMGALLASIGKLAEAESHFREALEGSRRVLGDDHPGTLTSINKMGALLNSMGKTSEAERYYREGLEGRRRVLGDDHPDTLRSINSVGVLLHSMGRLGEAEKHYREALAGSRRVLGDEHPSTLNSISNMGLLLKSMGKLGQAEPYYREALAGRRRVLGDDHPDTLLSINNMGVLLGSMGKLAGAEPYHREALAGWRRVLGDEHPLTLTSIGNMGWLLQEMGKPGEAESHFREALALAERLRTRIVGEERGRAAFAGKLRLSAIAARYASLLIEMNRPAEAVGVAERGRGRALLDLLARSDRDVIEQARKRAQEAGDAEAVAALESALGAEAQARADLTTAEALLAGTQKQRKHTEGRDDLSDDEKAARLAKLDQQIAEQHQAVKDKRHLLTEAGAKVLMQLRGLFPDARPMGIEQIRAGLEPGELVLGYTWSPEFVLAQAAPADGRGEVRGLVLAKGKEAVKELSDLVRRVRESVADRSAGVDAGATAELSGRLIPAELREPVRDAKRLIVLPDGPLHEIPFEVLACGPLPYGRGSDHGRGSDKGGAADRRSPGADLLGAGPEVVYAASATMYLNRRAAARRQGSGGVISAVVLGDPIFERQPPPEPDYPEQGVLLVMVSPDSNASRAGLSRGDVLLSYDGKELSDAGALGPAIAAVNQAVESGQRKADEPVRVSFWRAGKVAETTLSPGRMGVVPSKGKVAEGLRSMARSARGMEQAVAELSATDQVRLFGGRLTPLPGTAREARLIAKLFQETSRSQKIKTSKQEQEPSGTRDKNVVLLLGEDATIGKLDAAVAGKRYIHLATHGLTGNSERPYDASLALTRPKQVSPADIGFLRLGDLIRGWRGKLEECELVVLSACDTQRGVRRGTGIMALPWGFMYAGVPTVVASLWKVDDTATALLMARFYENVLGVGDGSARAEARGSSGTGRGMSKAEALREAKLWLRNLPVAERDRLVERLGLEGVVTTIAEAPKRAILTDREVEAGPIEPAEHRPYAHPYYWAAFILLGDPS